MAYGFTRAEAWVYDHVFCEPPDDWLGEPDPEEAEEEEPEEADENE